MGSPRIADSWGVNWCSRLKNGVYNKKCYRYNFAQNRKTKTEQINAPFILFLKPIKEALAFCVVFFVHAFAELFKKVFLLFRQTFRGFDIYRNEQVPARFTVDSRNALSAHRKRRSALSTLGNCQLTRTVGGRDSDFCA